MRRCSQVIAGVTAVRSVPIWMTQQLAIAALCHPSRAGQVAVVNISGTLWFQNRVDTEQNVDRFGPFRTIGVSIKQPHVEFDVRAIIFGQLVGDRRDVVKGYDCECHVEGRRKAQAAAAD